MIQGFELLTSIYLGQEWDEYGATPDEAIRAFVREESRQDIAAAIGGFEMLADSPLDEQEDYQRWVFGLQSAYDPRRDGYSFPAWYAHVLDVLRTAADRQA